MKKKAVEPKYHHGDLRRAILEAALELIEDAGIQNLSLREIARKIGVTTAAPYHHFKDREALLVQIATQGFEQLLNELDAAREQAKEVARELETEARAYLLFARTHAALYSVMFSIEVAMKYEYPDLKNTADRCFAIIVSSINRSTKLGAQKSAEASLCIWSMLHGLTVLDKNNFLMEEPSEQERIGLEGVLSIAKSFSRRMS